MHYLICLEASHQRGMGHLFRGLTLAEALREQGDSVVVALNEDARAIEIAGQKGFVPAVVPSYADGTGWEEPLLKKHAPQWWINDRLDTTLFHAGRITSAGVRLATFDDHGKGAELAEYNFLAMAFSAGTRAVNALYGADFIVLNPRIAQCREVRRQNIPPRNLLVVMGGSDTHGVTPRVVSLLSRLPVELSIQVVVGPNFRHHEELTDARGRLARPVTVRQGVPDLIDIMAGSDIIICGAGITLFEAAALGTPAVTIANEPHEIPIAAWFAANGASLDAGFHQDDFAEPLLAGIGSLLSDHGLLSRMSQKGQSLVDTRGLARVVSLLRGAP